MSFLSRRPAPTPARVLVASGRRLDLTDAKSKKRRKAAQWQDDAWHYRDTVGEIRYAMAFLKYACSKVRLIPAIANADGEEPTPLDEADGVPAAVVSAARDALARLTGGTFNYSPLLTPYAENLEVAGDCNLVGRLVDGVEEWGIYSIDEVRASDRGYQIVASADDRDGELLDPATSVVARLWTPHPRWRLQADSPMRSLLEPCEELALVSRMIRAASRSRLASAGLLTVPTEIDFTSTADPDDMDGDPFSTELARAMEAAIEDEGDPAALVPIVLRANAEALQGLKHITLASPVDEKMLDRVDKALARIATGLDVPPEIITGMADVNHWTAWQIDDSTYRNHIEPLVIRMVDGLTAGYYRAALVEYGVPPEWASRVIIWHDPSQLVVRPNRADDAKAGHSSNVLSDRTLVEALGFDPDVDMPTEDELARRLALTRGAMDGSITEALLRLLVAPGMDNVRHLPPGQVTVHAGQDAQDAERDNPPPSLGPTAAPAAAPADSPSPAEPQAEEPADDGDTTPTPTTGLPAINAAASPVLHAYTRESRRLADVDRQLRERLTAAADAAFRRALERAGNRVRTQANRDAEARAIVSAVPARRAAAALGPQLVAALGVDDDALLAGAFDDLAEQWADWTTQARDEALATAARIAGLDTADPAVAGQLQQLRDRLDDQAADGWTWMHAALSGMVTSALWDPDGDVDVEQLGEDPGRAGRLTQVARAAMAIAGGIPAGHGGVTSTGVAAQPGTPLPGIATGDVVDGFLKASGVQVIAYEWVYGISRRPFEPHLDLDGVTFLDFDDPVLANPIDWPAPTLAPGDHAGCHCDAMPIYADGTNASDTADQVGDATYDPTYMNVLRDLAATDIAAGRTDTTAVRTVEQADHVANARPSKRS